MMGLGNANSTGQFGSASLGGGFSSGSHANGPQANSAATDLGGSAVNKLSYSKWASNSSNSNTTLSGIYQQLQPHHQQQQQQHGGVGYQTTNMHRTGAFANQLAQQNSSNSYTNYLKQQAHQAQQQQQQHQNFAQHHFPSISGANAGSPSKDSKPQSSSTNPTSVLDPGEIESFELKLQLKDIVIAKLEAELEKEKEFQSTLSMSLKNNESFEIPKNHEQLYNKIVEQLQATKKELNETKDRLEALVTAVAFSPNNSNYKNGRYDEQEVAHKIISKMQILTEENEEMSKMLSYGKSKEKDIEIGLLRKQNTELREKITKLESKLSSETIDTH